MIVRKHLTRIAVLMTVAGCPLMSGCAGAQTPAVKPTVELTAKDYARLEVMFVKTNHHETSSTLSFSVRNPYQEAVEGVRVLYRSLTSITPDAPEAYRFAKRFDLKLGPGEAKELQLEIPRDRRGVKTFLLAYAVKLGAKLTPLPPQWQTGDEGTASK